MAVAGAVNRTHAAQELDTAAAAAAAGDLYGRYRNRVLRFCRSRLESREEAEDALQSTFFYAFCGLRRGVVPKAESSWLYAIAANVCRTQHRARGRRRTLEVLQDPQTLQEIYTWAYASSEELLGLDEALSSLPEQQRQAILLREWKGLTYREIATEMRVSGATVETLIFRARRSLAKRLADGEEQKSRRRFGGFDLGSLALALKSLLAGGSAAKLAAAAAAIATGALAAGGTLADHGRERPAPVTPPQRVDASPPPITGSGLPFLPANRHELASRRSAAGEQSVDTRLETTPPVRAAAPGVAAPTVIESPSPPRPTEPADAAPTFSSPPEHAEQRELPSTPPVIAPIVEDATEVLPGLEETTEVVPVLEGVIGLASELELEAPAVPAVPSLPELETTLDVVSEVVVASQPEVTTLVPLQTLVTP